ncbi:MAG: NUDIX domain-containing protein [Mycoplasmataceae bacterium]|jgi:8-oxo-dGTP pyrophosphatase MutT (NUDIX family)|nr:NUDIX domain-containing protein [Mycoplasmataceae bacterium]
MLLKRKPKVADKLDEILRVIDKNGEWTGRYDTRGNIHTNGNYYNNVATWIINTKNNTVLLEHRSPNKIRNPDKWCLPGGHIGGDDTPTISAQEEVKEEVGLDINIKKFKFLCISGPIDGSKSFTHHFYVLENKPRQYFKIQKEEVVEVRYVNYEDWKGLVKSNSKKVSPKWDKWSNAFELMDKVLKNK